MLSFMGYPAFDFSVQIRSVRDIFIVHIFKVQIDDVIAGDSFFYQFIPDSIEKNGFSASSYSGNDLDDVRIIIRTDLFADSGGNVVYYSYDMLNCLKRVSGGREDVLADFDYTGWEV